MQSLFYIFLGGGLGSLCRYGVANIVNEQENGFPFKTFLANILSCIILGFLLGYLSKNALSNSLKLLLMTGFCGGFSTFSTFSAEVFLLIENQELFTAFIYILSSVILCTLLLFGAYLIAQQI